MATDTPTGLTDAAIILGWKQDYISIKDQADYLAKTLREAMDMLDREITGRPQYKSYLQLAEQARIALSEYGDRCDNRFSRF